MSKAIWIKTDGAVLEVKPKGKYFSYEELQGFIRDDNSSMVEIVPLPSGKLLVCNEEGKLTDEPVINEVATEIWKKEYPISKYPLNNDQLMVGNVLITDPELLEE